MSKQQEVFFRQIVGTCDIAALVVSYAIAYWLRDRLFGPWYGALLPFAEYVWILWVVVPTWLFLFRRSGLYNPASYRSLGGLFRVLVKVQVLGGLCLLSVMYLTRSAQISRLLLQSYLAVSFVALAVEKGGVKAMLDYSRKSQGIHRRQVLVVGAGFRMERHLQLLSDHPHWSTEVIGFLSANGSENSQFHGKPVLGQQEDLSQVLTTHVVDEVVLVPSRGEVFDIKRLALACAERGITFRTLLEAPAAPIGRYRIEEVGGGRYFLSLEPVPLDPLHLLLKRLFDIVGATVGLLLCGPVLLWYSFRIRRESPGSALFCQTRVGQNGRLFSLYKFRTMYPDAEERLKDLLTCNEMQGFIFKMKDDPRVTPTGGVLRRRHLDELPQFWNVLKGEMSLVGTRPPTPNEVAEYRPHHHRRLSMKPGITGLWQLNGNEAVNDFEDVVRLDWEYITNWSLWLDCKVLAKTAVKVVRGGGW
jgi:exopolysaccharide biosynthesis polyprenyl glycosylphosphotransferase